MRPNLAQDKPPTELTVGGNVYKIETDFRVWIDVLRDLRDLTAASKDAEHNLGILARVENAIFGRLIPEAPADVLTAIMEFSTGYPQAPVGEGESGGAQTYSFDWDLNYIIIAIMNQFGIDLTWRRREPFHWWLFLLYFRALSGDHYILRLMETRGYDGKDPELKRRARRYALPREETAEDRQILEEFDELFYGA